MSNFPPTNESFHSLSQASHADLIGNDVLDIVKITAIVPSLHTTAGKRHYIIVYGDQGGDTGVVVMGGVGTASHLSSAHDCRLSTFSVRLLVSIVTVITIGLM